MSEGGITRRGFKPGISGNPGGPPKGIMRRIREQYGADVPRMIGVFVDLAMGKVPEGYDAEIKTSDRIKAGTEACDRIIGKAPQTIDLKDERDRVAVDLSALTDEQVRALAAIPVVEDESDPALDDVH